MKKLALAAVAAAAAFTAAPAFAQDASSPQFYGSIGAAMITDDFVDLGAIQARVGVRGTHFGLEAEGSIGVMDDELFGVDVDLEYQAGIYAVVFLPVSDNVEFHGRLGYSNFEVGAGGGSASVDTFNVGIGASFSFSEKDAIRGDYTYMDDGGTYANMWSLAYVRKF